MYVKLWSNDLLVANDPVLSLVTLSGRHEPHFLKTIQEMSTDNMPNLDDYSGFH